MYVLFEKIKKGRINIIKLKLRLIMWFDTDTTCQQVLNNDYIYIYIYVCVCMLSL